AVVWQALCTAIDELRRSGVSTVRILDAGCGPGTWIRRTASLVHRQGLGVDALGFDLSTRQLEIAQKRADSPRAANPEMKGVQLRFLQHSLADPLPWADGQFHIVLCNFAVLNHLPKTAVPGAIAELCRVAQHRILATLRALGSPPTACIVATEQVREYHQD